MYFIAGNRKGKKMQQYPEWITPDLAVGYAPRSQEALSVIRDRGIGAIVNLCAECYDLHELEKKAGFDVRYVPVHDEDAPSMKELEKTLAWITENIKAGKKVLVHCRFGIGRTGTVVAAYLMSEGLSFKAALGKMAHTPSTPMSRQQFRLLKEYSAALGLRKAPVREAEKKSEAESSTFFEKWEALRDWFESD